MCKKCVRCGNDMPLDYLFFCEYCTNSVDDDLIKLKDIYETYLPFPYEYDPDTEEYEARLQYRACIESLIEYIVRNPDYTVEDNIYNYIGEIYWRLGLVTREDDVYMLDQYAKCLEWCSDVLYTEKWRKLC